MKEKMHAKITGINAFLPDYILTNDELSKMVDTSDDWITQRVGIRERRILKDDKLILTAFGGGFTWGTIYLTWTYK